MSKEIRKNANWQLIVIQRRIKPGVTIGQNSGPLAGTGFNNTRRRHAPHISMRVVWLVGGGQVRRSNRGVTINARKQPEIEVLDFKQQCIASIPQPVSGEDQLGLVVGCKP